MPYVIRDAGLLNINTKLEKPFLSGLSRSRYIGLEVWLKHPIIGIACYIINVPLTTFNDKSLTRYASVRNN